MARPELVKEEIPGDNLDRVKEDFMEVLSFPYFPDLLRQKLQPVVSSAYMVNDLEFLEKIEPYFWRTSSYGRKIHRRFYGRAKTFYRPETGLIFRQSSFPFSFQEDLAHGMAEALAGAFTEEKLIGSLSIKKEDDILLYPHMRADRVLEHLELSGKQYFDDNLKPNADDIDVYTRGFATIYLHERKVMPYPVDSKQQAFEAVRRSMLSFILESVYTGFTMVNTEPERNLAVGLSILDLRRSQLTKEYFNQNTVAHFLDVFSARYRDSFDFLYNFPMKLYRHNLREFWRSLNYYERQDFLNTSHAIYDEDSFAGMDF